MSATVTETLAEVQCPRSFAGHDGLIEPISTNQFKHYAVSRSLCHSSLTDGKAVVRIMNIKPHAFVIRKGERVGTIENIDVKTQCTPFIDTEDTSHVAKPIFRREQPYDPIMLEQYAKEYAFQINPDLSADQRTELFTLLRCPNFSDIYFLVYQLNTIVDLCFAFLAYCAYRPMGYI